MTLISIPNPPSKDALTELYFIQQSHGNTYVFGLKKIDETRYKYVGHIVCGVTFGDFAFLSRKYPDIDCFCISSLDGKENEKAIKRFEEENEYCDIAQMTQQDSL